MELKNTINPNKMLMSNLRPACKPVRKQSQQRWLTYVINKDDDIVPQSQ